MREKNGLLIDFMMADIVTRDIVDQNGKVRQQDIQQVSFVFKQKIGAICPLGLKRCPKVKENGVSEQVCYQVTSQGNVLKACLCKVNEMGMLTPQEIEGFAIQMQDERFSNEATLANRIFKEQGFVRLSNGEFISIKANNGR